MKRPGFILLSGLALAAAGFIGAYAFEAGHPPEPTPRPELAWLKQEYQLADAPYARICKMYAAYHPQCVAMCRAIDAKDAELRSLLAATNTVTPEIRQALMTAAQLRATCEIAMLNHFYEVSQAMPPTQGVRYLAWVQNETLVPSPMAGQAPPAQSARSRFTQTKWSD